MAADKIDLIVDANADIFGHQTTLEQTALQCHHAVHAKFPNAFLLLLDQTMEFPEGGITQFTFRHLNHDTGI